MLHLMHNFKRRCLMNEIPFWLQALGVGGGLFFFWAVWYVGKKASHFFDGSGETTDVSSSPTTYR